VTLWTDRTICCDNKSKAPMYKSTTQISRNLPPSPGPSPQLVWQAALGCPRQPQHPISALPRDDPMKVPARAGRPRVGACISLSEGVGVAFPRLLQRWLPLSLPLVCLALQTTSFPTSQRARRDGKYACASVVHPRASQAVHAAHGMFAVRIRCGHPPATGV